MINNRKVVSDLDVPEFPRVTLVLDQDEGIAMIGQNANAYIRSRGNSYSGSLSSFARAWTPKNPTLKIDNVVRSSSILKYGISLVLYSTVIYSRHVLRLVLRGLAVVTGKMSCIKSSTQSWLEDRIS